ncbi:response regulator [Ruminococcus sp.]|uniref:response regulator n=1 Tax=Ruminococcus sp. TaxID=41978 RepID=UPI0025D43F0D|nr:response regulator [Ruminococcus sp.]
MTSKTSSKKRRRALKSRNITICAVVIFLLITVLTLISARYMSECISRENAAQVNRGELSDLGQELADASDYLTDEARKFSVTGDVKHLYNYWFEVYEDKTRDRVINSLSALDPPENESQLLAEAKKYSDTLIKTETISMKLMLTAEGITADQYKNGNGDIDSKIAEYIALVENTEMPEEYSGLTPAEMKERSREMLYDSFYNDSKTMIMSPIDRFRHALNRRLDAEVENAAAGRETASMIQLVCSVSVLVIIGIVLIVFEQLYVRPINDYSESLDTAELDLSNVRVSPKGAYELFHFGELFNRLSQTLQNELKKREQAEAQMKQAKDEADRANSAKSDFLAQMSHELRTPLNAITGYLYLLSKTDLEDSQQRYVKNIDTASENLLGLINNVLDFSKIESGNLQLEYTDLDLVKLLGDTYSIMESAALSKGIALRLDISGDIPSFVSGDPLRLQQVLVNLLGNAVKFTESGEVVLGCKCLETKGRTALVEFSVTDSGEGIAQDKLESIFEPFIQSDAGVTRRHGGTGLGLPISQSIVKAASGGKHKIEVVSQLGKGSTFTFCMPFDIAEPPKPQSDNAPIDGEAAVQAHILLVDDNKVNLDIEREILCTYGLQVDIADSGMKAIDYCRTHRPDMIILDLHMPDMDGYETARRIRELEGFGITPIIALTADVVSGIEQKVYAAGMDGYISKPFRPDDLRKMIYKYLHISRAMPQKSAEQGDEVFDCVACLDALGGSKTILFDIIKRFISEHSSDCDYICQHIKAGNYANARIILHDVIGISGNLCCKKLHESSKALSDMLKSDTPQNADTADFEADWQMAVKRLGEFLKLTEDGTARSSAQDRPKFVSELLELCANFDISAADYFERHRGEFKDHMDKTKFRKLEEYINKYDLLSITQSEELWR